MCSTVTRWTSCLVLLPVAGLLLPVVFVNLSNGGPMLDSVPSSAELLPDQLPTPEPLVGPSESLPSPYQMVAHSDYTDRLLLQQLQHSSSGAGLGQKNQSVSSQQPPGIPARKRSTNDNGPVRTRYSQAPPGSPGDPSGQTNRPGLLWPGRYYDSYGEWHHGGDGWQGQSYGSSGNWGWAPNNQHHQHHGNSHGSEVSHPYHHHQQHGLLGLQLVTLLHPVLLLGTMSFLVCLINGVLGLVDKIKLPLMRTRDLEPLIPGLAGLRDERDEYVLGQVYHFLAAVMEQQQQRNETLALSRL